MVCAGLYGNVLLLAVGAVRWVLKGCDEPMIGEKAASWRLNRGRRRRKIEKQRIQNLARNRVKHVVEGVDVAGVSSE